MVQTRWFVLVLASASTACNRSPLPSSSAEGSSEGTSEYGDLIKNGGTSEDGDLTDGGDLCEADSQCAYLDTEHDCTKGHCVDGDCVAVLAPDGSACDFNGDECNKECWSGTCSPEGNINPCTDFDLGCNLGSCDYQPEVGACGVDLCDHWDGVPDLALELTAREFPIPPGLFVGAHLQIHGYRELIDDSWSRRFEVVRSLDDGEIVFASWHPASDSEFVESVTGVEFATLFDPFVSVEDVNFGYCEPVPDPDNDPNCQITDVSVVIEHKDGTSSQLSDDSFGYANGFGLTAENVYFDQDCNEPYPYRRVYATRLGCDGDCPPPTVTETCEGDTLAPVHDAGRVLLLFDYFYPYATWEFDCTVLAVNMSDGPEGSVAVDVPLDCLSDDD